MSKQPKAPHTNFRASEHITPTFEGNISVSLQYLSKNKQRNFEFFSKNLRTRLKALEEFLDLLKRLTSKTRLEISSIPKESDCGFEEIPFEQINCSPDGIILDKGANIFIFRFCNGKYRLLGFFTEKAPVFNVIGFDFNYSAYSHGS